MGLTGGIYNNYEGNRKVAFSGYFEPNPDHNVIRAGGTCSGKALRRDAGTGPLSHQIIPVGVGRGTRGQGTCSLVPECTTNGVTTVKK